MLSLKANVIVFCALLSVVFANSLYAQVFDEQFESWPLHTSFKGTLIVDNELEEKEKLIDSLRGIEDQNVLIVADRMLAPSKLIELQLHLKDKGAKCSVFTYESFSPAVFDRFNEAKTVFFYNSDSFDSYKSFLDWSNEQKDPNRQILQYLLDGNTLIINKPVAKCVVEYYQDNEDHIDMAIAPLPLEKSIIPEAKFNFSFDVDQTEELRRESSAEPFQMLKINMTRNLAMKLSGRKVTVIGPGSVTFSLPAGGARQYNRRRAFPSEVQTIVQRTSRRMPADRWLVDLTQWRRGAMDRSLEQFPPEKPRTPFVENGTLVIVGGGGMPRGLMNDFIEYAGGKENAKLVYVPCSEQDDVGANAGTVAMWKRMGVEHATMIHTKDRNKANSDEEFLAPLKDATGIWFGGGRQWNFADSYYGTKAHKLMKDVLKRGGVIGGSSAGASIQARFLARATPIGNTSILAPGYQRGGLGFISGVAIDQHFSQRRRQADMSQLVDKYPQMLGIGIDEATALIVHKSQGNVVGRGSVFFYDRNQPIVEGKPDYISLPAGSVYDLANRKVVKDTTEQNGDTDDNE